MPNTVLFIQGGGGKDVHDAWDSKLVRDLKQRLGPDFDVRYPRMPNENNPNYESWRKAILVELSELDDGAFVVARSIGATILAHALAEHPGQRSLAGIFLISMPFVGEGGWPSDDIGAMPNLGAALPSCPIFIYQGEADETVTPDHAQLNAKAIPLAIVRALPDHDHQLNNDMSEVASDILEQLVIIPQREIKRE